MLNPIPASVPLISSQTESLLLACLPKADKSRRLFPCRCLSYLGMQLAEAAPPAAAWLLARGFENHLREAWPLVSEAQGREAGPALPLLDTAWLPESQILTL